MAAVAEVGVQLRCPMCMAGNTRVGTRDGKIVHRIPFCGTDDTRGRYLGLALPKIEGETINTLTGERYLPCPDWDWEFRHVSEPLGFYMFAWWPRRCRNGKLRWLTSVERHDDGTFTLGNRAH